ILNPFSSNFNFPLDIVPTESIKVNNLLSDCVFVSIPVFNIDTSFNSIEYLNKHFKTSNVRNVYIPNEEGKSSGIMIIVFNSSKDVKEFYDNNKNIKIDGK